MRISDWSSDVCSSDLVEDGDTNATRNGRGRRGRGRNRRNDTTQAATVEADTTVDTQQADQAFAAPSDTVDAQAPASQNAQTPPQAVETEQSDQERQRRRRLSRRGRRTTDADTNAKTNSEETKQTKNSSKERLVGKK